MHSINTASTILTDQPAAIASAATQASVLDLALGRQPEPVELPSGVTILDTDAPAPVVHPVLTELANHLLGLIASGHGGSMIQYRDRTGQDYAVESMSVSPLGVVTIGTRTVETVSAISASDLLITIVRLMETTPVPVTSRPYPSLTDIASGLPWGDLDGIEWSPSRGALVASIIEW